jgi:hypothetical protein
MCFQKFLNNSSRCIALAKLECDEKANGTLYVLDANQDWKEHGAGKFLFKQPRKSKPSRYASQDSLSHNLERKTIPRNVS